MKKRILVPVDFSPSSDMALTYALNFATFVGADEIHLLHAVQVPINTADTVISVTGMLMEDAQKKMEEVKQKTLLRSEAQNRTILTRCLVEDVITAVRDYTKEINPDYIVMGTKGATGLQEFMFGTTAADLLENSEIPVLVVPEYNEFKKPEEVVFAADLKNLPDKEVLAPLKNLVIGFNARLMLLHISTDLNLTETEEQEKTALKEYFHGLDLQFRVIHSENIYTGIEVYMQDNSPGMLAVLSHKYNFFERIFHSSIAKKIAHRTLIPMLSLREK
jgi:nucleotide-binding universal stress UspA family protein